MSSTSQDVPAEGRSLLRNQSSDLQSETRRYNTLRPSPNRLGTGQYGFPVDNTGVLGDALDRDLSPRAVRANPRSTYNRMFSNLVSSLSGYFGLGRHAQSEKVDDATGRYRQLSSKKPETPTNTKLGTFSGVFVPTTLNVLSILMFLRFGFILGQSGSLAMLGMLAACYVITTTTTMSISAIATNGTVRGGGAYYLISRSLGQEFGASIGLVLWIGFCFNTGMNAVGLTDCFRQAWGMESGNWSQWLPDSYWYLYLWSSIILLVCVMICMAGSSFFARCSGLLLVLLLVATLSIPISAIFVQPFEQPELHVKVTGLSLDTFKENLLPHLTKGASGSQATGREDFQDLFGVLFPATAGIFAGASMSGDLRQPSRSIPKGTLSGLGVTFLLYALVICFLAASVSRSTFYGNVNVVQDVNLSGWLILLGEFAAAFFSVLMGVIGAAKLLQALARDRLFPGLSIFAKGTKGSDNPIYAIIATYFISQLTLFADINKIASLVTMAYLMSFTVVNLACFLLKISSAPNFRPSFHYFRWWTAFGGTILSVATMFFVDGIYASGCIAILLILFILIHFTAEPKAWGDVSQSLIYHQVRKYLLRLRQEHVKYWRPQILLFVNDPRRSYKLIQFCNSLKKGSLFILGHVIVTQDFAGSVDEARKQHNNWTKYIDFSKIKAFVNVAISDGVEWGTRNVVMSSGLGGMRPNIIVLGFYNLDEYRATQPDGRVPNLPPSRPATPTGVRPSRRKRPLEDKLKGELPTDTNRPEKAVSPSAYLTVLEDLLLRLRTNVAIARGFNDIDLPVSDDGTLQSFIRKLRDHDTTTDQDGDKAKRYIDLWPIQMTAEIQASDDTRDHLFSTNFDTYALILQLGCILHTVSSWKQACHLRVSVFVEYESDVEEERGRVELLLSKLRIEAEVRVFWLASGKLKSYELLVNGFLPDEDYDTIKNELDIALQDEEWWQEIQEERMAQPQTDTESIQPLTTRSATNLSNLSEVAFSATGTSLSDERFERLGRMLRRKAFQPTMGGLNRMGVNFSMQTNRLDPQLVGDPESSSVSEESDGSSSEDDTYSDASESIWMSSSQERSRQDSIASETGVERYEFEDSPTYPESIDAPRRATVTTIPVLSPSQKVSRPTSRQAISISTSSEEAPRPSKTSSGDDGGQEYFSSHNRSTPSTPMITPGGTQSSKKPSRPATLRQKSQPKLSSNLVPRTTVSNDDGPGPSIMFQTQSPPSRGNRLQSIYNRSDAHKSREQRRQSIVRARSASVNSFASASSRGRAGSISTFGDTASGYPSSQATQLNFNSLPCRAQHIVLNELMRRKCPHEKTAVIFTTLPAPFVGTSESEIESLRYLGDLETLCNGLPPCLLVHSNSVTVTTSL